jgi:hypothetical protein
MNIIIAFLISVFTLFTVPPYATYDNNDMTLDTPLTELNNHTLREVFEDIIPTYWYDELVDNKLPNGVRNEIVGTDYTQRVKKYTLQASDIIGLYTPPTNVDYVIMPLTIFNDILGFGIVDLLATKIFTDKTIPLNNKTIDSLGSIWNHYIQASDFRFNVPNETYQTLAEVQADLVGTVIYYQLATPIVTHLDFAVTTAQLDYYYSLYQDLQDLDSATIIYLDYDLHDIALIIFFGFLWLSLIILLKRKVLI